MIKLRQSATDKLQLISSSAATLDVVCSHVDLNTDGAGDPGEITSTPTAIVTATTTDIVATPASGKSRNVEEIHVRNKHATLACDVTVVFNRNASLYELHKATLAAGESLEKVEGLGWFKITNRLTPPAPNFSTAAQTPAAATLTQLNGSTIIIPATKMRIGTMFEWKFDITKTGAGTATSAYHVRVGTNNTTADAAILTFTKPLGSAVIDTGFIEISAVVRGPLSASCVMVGQFELRHNLSATGHAAAYTTALPGQIVTVSGSWDVTVANLFVSLSCTTGGSDLITTQFMKACAFNL